MNKETPVSAYRWVILFAILPIIISIQIFWLSFAPISTQAASFYGVSDLGIALFSMSYLIMFIIFTLPASWVIDKFGFRYSLIIGSILTAVFGLLRAVFANNYAIALVCQFVIAAAQPFLLNISTKVPANWFPVSERSTAAGILTMAQYIGFAVAMLISPSLTASYGIPGMLMVVAWIAIISAPIAIFLTREKPKVAPPGPAAPKEDFSFRSFKGLFVNKSFVIVLIIAFISIGIFNTILTLIDTILLPRGLTSDQSGTVGAIFVLAGIAGAVILPIISDKVRKRKLFFILTIALLIPLYLGLTFVPDFLTLTLIAGTAGFFIMGVAPILFQHGAEVAYPVQEGTSYGAIMLMGQISGALFILLFELISGASGNILLPMLLLVAATAVELPITLRVKESSLIAGK